MFDRISFSSFSGTISTAVRDTPRYRDFALKNEIFTDDNAEFSIDGSSKYLLGHPLTEQTRKSFLYIQSFSYMETGPAYFTDRSDYPSYLILYTYSGSGTLDYAGKSYHLQKGDGFLIDCRKRHTYKTAGGSWTHGDLHFSGGNSDELYSALFCGSAVFHVQTESVFQNALEDLLYVHTRPGEQRDARISLLLNHLLQIIFTSDARSENGESVRELGALQQYLESHFTEEISLETMEEIAGFSKYHLIREFKKAVGFTPHQYLIHLRLLQAEQLLMMTDIPSYKIGRLMGFTTEAAFINAFKKAYGSTPAQFRKNNGK